MKKLLSLEKFDEMPQGWRLDKSWGSPEYGWIPVCNGKSVLNGGKKGLLRLDISRSIEVQEAPVLPVSAPQKTARIEPTQAEKEAVAQSVNQLAREKFKLKLMQEIVFDLLVCKIEGWDSDQYARELKRLIDETHRKISGTNRRYKQSARTPKDVREGAKTLELFL